MDSDRAEIVEGLNVFRALEAWGAELYAYWSMHEDDPELRAGHLIIAEREANHARLLAERLRALGSEPAPACVDSVLAAQLEELKDLRGFVAQLDGLKTCRQRDAGRMKSCDEALDRGFKAAQRSDAATHAFWAQLYSEEKVSGDWYRSTYSRLTGRRHEAVPPPLLAPDQVIRRSSSSRT